MKKGCFLSVIIVLTLISILIFYLLSTHGEEIVSFGTSKLVKLAETEVFDSIEKLQQDEHVDSFKIVINNYFNKISQLDAKQQLEKIDELSENIDVILMDNKIDSVEIQFFKKFINRHE